MVVGGGIKLNEYWRKLYNKELTFKSVPVTLRTARFKQSKILHCDHMEFVCFVWISERTANFALCNIKRLMFITEVESVYCTVGTESLYDTHTFRLQKINAIFIFS